MFYSQKNNVENLLRTHNYHFFLSQRPVSEIVNNPEFPLKKILS